MSTEIRDDAEFRERIERTLENLNLERRSSAVISTANVDNATQPGQDTTVNIFPFTYPVNDLGTIGNATIELFLEKGNHWFKGILNGDIGLAFSNPPKDGFVFYFEITQDATGGWSITSVPTALQNGSVLDSLLDKTANAVTLFRFETSDEGVTYFGEKIDLGISAGTVPNGTAENDHLQWDSGAWVQRQTFEFNSTGPWGDSGFLRFPNNQIIFSARNATNTGNLELKADSAGFLDFTESSNGIAGLKIRAQHAVDPDNTLTLQQNSGVGGIATLFSPNQFNFEGSGSAAVFNFDQNRIQTNVNILPDADGTILIGNTTSPNRFLGFYGSEHGFDATRRIVFSTTGATLNVNGVGDTYVITVDSVQRVSYTGTLTQFTGNVDVLGRSKVGTYAEFPEQASDPAAVTDSAILYSKDDAGITKLFFRTTTATNEIVAGANQQLSNLVGPVAVNTTLQANNDGLTNLGSFSFHWDEIYGRTLIFKEDKPVDATETAIGANSSELWLNQTQASNIIAFRWDDVLSYEFGRTFFRTQNPVLLWEMINSTTNTFSITDIGTYMEFKNSNYELFEFEGLAHTAMRLIGTGFVTAGLNQDEILFDSSTSTANAIAGQMHFVGHTDLGANFDIAKIVAKNQVPTNSTRSGLVEFRTSDNGTENDLFMDLDGFNKKIGIYKNIDVGAHFYEVDAMTAPTHTTTTKRYLFVDSADNHIKVRTDTGLVDLEAGGGGGAQFIAENNFQTDHTEKDLWYSVNMVHRDPSESTFTNVAVTLDQLYAYPMYISETKTLKNLSPYVGTGSSSKMITAIYENKTNGQFYPGTKIVESSSNFLNFTGYSTVVASYNETLTPGVYWICQIYQSNTSSSTYRVDSKKLNFIGWDQAVDPDVFGAVYGYRIVSQTTFPTTFPTGALPIRGSDGLMPMIWAKF